MNATLLKSKGIPPGPLYARIKNGENISCEDGTIIRPEDVVGPPYPGRKVVVLGDTCDSEGIAELAINADVLVHEATNENAHEEKCIENGHSTPGSLFLISKYHLESLCSYLNCEHNVNINIICF